MVADRILIGVSGRIASGKSKLAETVALELASPTASFGDYCRKVSKDALGRQDRPLLQDFGRALVRYPESFSYKVLEDAGALGRSTVVVEGIRHVDVWTSLREIVNPSTSHLIYLEVPEEEIRRRLRAESLQESEIEELERDDTETDLITQIPEIADLRLAWVPERSITNLSSTVMQALKGLTGETAETQTAHFTEVDWKRYHALVSTGLRRRLTAQESKELLAFEKVANREDLDELLEKRDDLRKAKEAHESAIGAVSQLTDALERWLEDK